MKRIFRGLFATILAVATCFCAASCGDEVIDGSKIENCVVTFDVDGTEEKINVKLYVNFTAATVEHFKYLVEKKYYDGSKVSNVKDYVEFGLLGSDGKTLDGKYAEIITKDYASALKMGKNKDRARYTSDLTINGEFKSNGIENNSTLTFDGALVLKRGLTDIGDYANDGVHSFDSGKGVMAFTFGTNSYFSNADEFAILGKVVTNDADGDVKSSYDRLKALMTDNASDEYYYSYVCDSDDATEKAKFDELIALFGRSYMENDEGEMLYKNADGEYVSFVLPADYVSVNGLTEDDVDDFLADFDANQTYASVLPKTAISVKSITFSK